MTPDQRLRARALIERLTSDEPRFSPDDAAALIRLVPVHRKPRRFRLIVRRDKRRSSTAGYAAGVGNVTVQQGDDPQRFAIGEPPLWRIGGYDVTHGPGELEIAHMWADTKVLEDDGLRCLLEYERDGAMTLYAWAPRHLMLPLGRLKLGISFGGWKAWKRPRVAQG